MDIKKYWYVLPGLNILISLVAGVINKIGQNMYNQHLLLISALGEKLSNCANSNFVGDCWLCFFSLTVIITIISFICDLISDESSYYNFHYVWIVCAISVIFSLIITYFLFS